MCGATLLGGEVPTSQGQRATTQGSATASAPPAPPIRPRAPEPARAAAPSSGDRPSISGPSFLGLNEPPRPAPRKSNAGLSIDPESSSSNLDYLLEDEEPPRGMGAGKIFLILIALALAVGFGYLRWKGHGLPWLSSGQNKPAAVAKGPETSDSGSAAPANPAPESQAPPANSTAPTNSTGTTATPATGTLASTPANSTAPASNGSPNNSAPPAGNGSTGSSTSPGSNNSPNSAAATPPAAPPAKPEAKADNAAPAPSVTAGDGSSDNDNSDSATGDESAATAPKPKPAAKPRPAVDPVTEAQKYLYGRGVAQDCDRGLRLLKPAANAANPKAMVEMGALYSAGLCTPHDLPTAYRWFAMALRKDPGNQAIDTDLQKLWGEMTQPERQLAIRLTQ